MNFFPKNRLVLILLMVSALLAAGEDPVGIFILDSFEFDEKQMAESEQKISTSGKLGLPDQEPTEWNTGFPPPEPVRLLY